MGRSTDTDSLVVTARPAQIERYLVRAITQPPEAPHSITLHQRGEMRLAPERAWMTFTAQQRLACRETSFVWRARFRWAPLLTGVVEDALERGRGRLDARLWGFIPVARGRGPDIDRGEAQRYLAELPWCPHALRDNPALRFREMDEYTVRVSVFDEETWVDLSFDDAGDIVRARTDTRMRGDETQPWEGEFFDYRSFGGIRAPARGRVAWKPASGDFEYWRGEITELRVRT